MSEVPKKTSLALPDQTPAMPTAIALYLDDNLYNRVTSVAQRMAAAVGMTPQHLIRQPEACFAVVTRAITWKLDPFAVAMATYQTPGGRIGFEGKLVTAILENSGRLDPTYGGVRLEYYGDWSKIQGKFTLRESKKEDDNGNKKKYAYPTWTDEDAIAGGCGVIVRALLRGEKEPRTFEMDLVQAQPRNSTLWATDPKTQLGYTATRRFASVVASALMMGVPFDVMDWQEPEKDMGAAVVVDSVPQPRAKQPESQSAANAQEQPASPGPQSEEHKAEQRKPEEQKKAEQKAPQPLSEGARATLLKAMQRAGKSDVDLDAKFGFKSDTMTFDLFNDVMAWLNGTQA